MIEKEKLFVDDHAAFLQATGYPIEFSFFYNGTYDNLVVAVKKVTSIRPYNYTAADIYFDTTDHSLFKHNLSVRLRQIDNPTDRYFILMVTLKPGAKESATGAKETVYVQEVLEDTYPMDQLIESYTSHGLIQVAKVSKTRTAFVLKQLSFKESAGKEKVSQGFPNIKGNWESKDYGLRILIDQFEEPVNDYRIAIEIEFGDRTKEAALNLRQKLLDLLGNELVSKGSKIEYFQPGPKG